MQSSSQLARNQSRAGASHDESSSSDSAAGPADSDYDIDECGSDAEGEEIATCNEDTVTLRAQLVRKGKPVQSIESDTHPLQLQPHRRPIGGTGHHASERSLPLGMVRIAPSLSFTEPSAVAARLASRTTSQPNSSSPARTEDDDIPSSQTSAQSSPPLPTFTSINAKAAELRRRPNPCTDAEDLQTTVKAAPHRRKAHPDPPKASRMIRAGTAAFWSPPDSQTPEKLVHQRALDTFKTLPKRKLRKLELSAGSSGPRFIDTPTKTKSSKRGRSIVSGNHSMANTLSTAEVLRSKANAAYFAEHYPPLSDDDDEIGPATFVKRPRTKSPKGKGRADFVVAEPVQNTASDDNDESSAAARSHPKSRRSMGRAEPDSPSSHESASDDDESSDYSSNSSEDENDDEDKEANEQGFEHSLDDEEGDGVESDDGETIIEPMDNHVIGETRNSSPDLGSWRGATVANTVDANVPAAKDKKHKRKRTDKPDVEIALPESSTPKSSSAELEEVQTLPKRKKQKKDKSVAAAVPDNNAEQASRDMPATESSTSVAPANQQSLPAKKKVKKDKSTSCPVVVDSAIADTIQSEEPAAESSAAEKKKAKKGRNDDTTSDSTTTAQGVHEASDGEPSRKPPQAEKIEKSKRKTPLMHANTGSFVESPTESSAVAQRRHKLEVKNGKKRQRDDGREMVQPSQESQHEKKSKKKGTSPNADTGSLVQNHAESSANAQRRHKLVKDGKKKSTQRDEAHATVVEVEAISTRDVLDSLEATLAKQAMVHYHSDPCPVLAERANTSPLSSSTESRPSWPRKHARLKV